jgi:hypothetical protein
LVVPEAIQDIERDLRTKWTESEREDKRLLMEAKRVAAAQLREAKRRREETPPAASQLSIDQSPSDTSSPGEQLARLRRKRPRMEHESSNDEEELPGLLDVLARREEQDIAEPAEVEPAKPHGLTSGPYEMTCRSVSSSSEEDFDLTLAFDKDVSLWAAFHFNILWGVLHLPRLPALTSSEHLEFDWQGQCQGGNSYVCGQGWLCLLGNGRLKGEIRWLGKNHAFTARRIVGKAMTKAVTVKAMKKEWAEYADTEW